MFKLVLQRMPTVSSLFYTVHEIPHSQVFERELRKGEISKRKIQNKSSPPKT